MRMMLRITVPVQAGNKALAEGTLPQVVGATMERLKPESAYFFPYHGKRCSIMVFDLAETSDLPASLESLFQKLDAEIEIHPVMNADELAAGLTKMKG